MGAEQPHVWHLGTEKCQAGKKKYGV